MSGSTSDPPINLDGKVKMGTRSLVAIAIALYILAGGIFRLPTKEDFDEHNDSSEAHPQLREVAGGIRAEVVEVKSRIALLEQGQRDTHDDIEYVRSRVDFLTDQAVRKAAEEGARSRVEPRRAAAVGQEAVERLRMGEPPQAAVEGSLEGL